jgi:hypothetical protein
VDMDNRELGAAVLPPKLFSISVKAHSPLYICNYIVL